MIWYLVLSKVLTKDVNIVFPLANQVYVMPERRILCLETEDGKWAAFKSHDDVMFDSLISTAEQIHGVAS